MKHVRRFGLVFLGLFLGTIIFFPWNDLRDHLVSTVQSSTDMQLQMQDFSPTLGLRAGLTHGSVLAFSATKASLKLPDGKALFCNELILGPRLWPVLLAQIHLSVSCLSEDGGSAVVLVKASPLWGPTSADIDAVLDRFSVENVDLRMSLAGAFSGTVRATNVKIHEAGIPNIEWALKGSGVRTPAANFPLAKLPSLDLATVDTRGSVSPRAIKVESLKFGNAQTLIEGDVKFLSDNASESFYPQDGELSGTLRIDPAAENGELKNALSWKTVFGPPDERGSRTFKRPFKGGVQTLIFSAASP